MARIKIEDIPRDREISDEEMKQARGGILATHWRGGIFGTHWDLPMPKVIPTDTLTCPPEGNAFDPRVGHATGPRIATAATTMIRKV